MKRLFARKLRSTMTVAAASGLLVTGISFAPGVGAAEAAAGAQDSAKAPSTTCYVDGSSMGEGTPVGSGPPKWKYSSPATPWAGLRYNRCNNTVTLYYGGYSFPSWYQVEWGITPQQEVHRYKSNGAGSRFKTVTASHTDNTTIYTLHVKACSGNLCTQWSPLIILSYYP